MTSYLSDHGWICTDAGTTVRSYMLSASIQQQMRTTAFELDEILEPYVDLVRACLQHAAVPLTLLIRFIGGYLPAPK